MPARLDVHLRLLPSLLLASACGSSSPAPAGSAKTSAAPTPKAAGVPEAKPVVLDLEGKAEGSMKTAVTKVVDEAKVQDGPVEEGKADAGETAGDLPVVGPPPARRSALSAFFWADGVDGKTVIDMIDVADPTGKGDIVMALADPNGHPDGIQEVLPADATLPPGFAVGNEWVVAGVDGEHRGKSVAFGAFGGAGENHFTVVLDGEFTGLAARPGDWKGPVPRLRAVEQVDLGTGEGKALFDAIRADLVATAPKSVRKALGRKRIGSKHLQVAKGSFPDGMTHIVAVTVELRPDDIAADRISGLLLADATGRLEAVHPLSLSMDAFELRYLVDLEGDGQDEVVWDSFYYEGRYAILTGWDAAGARIDRTLTGDGA